MLNTLLVLAVLFDGFFLSLTGIERRYAYPLDPTRIAPADVGLPQVSERHLKSGTATLVIWVAPADEGKPTVLYFQGNGGNLANRAQRFQLLTDRGYGLIAPAYRGSSGSTGKPNEDRLTRDALRVWSSLDAFVPGLSPNHMVIYGESLGGGVALKLLAQPGVTQPAGVVLDSPFTSYPDVARHLAPDHARLIARMTNIWNNAAHVKTLTAPLLVLHGTADTLVPYSQGQQVFATATSATKHFVSVKGADHLATWTDQTEPQLWRFIDGLHALSIP